MGNILIVPVQVDALVLNADQMAVEASADFSRLPYTTPNVDVHPNNPYISEEIISKPFQNNTLNLSKGIHLHWSLPDSLTHGISKKNGRTEFPLVPNRWLIRRLRGETMEKEWVVLSDYLHPDGEGQGNVCIPFESDPANKDFQPFRFLGKQIPFDAFNQEEVYPAYPDLTIMGYGEPTFAAFYPNCHSVFGFFDPMVERSEAALDTSDLAYEVLGWYSNDDKDFIKKQINAFRLQHEKEHQSDTNPTPQASNEEVFNFIKNTLKWTVAESENSPNLPEEMICYSRLTFDPSENKLPSPRAEVAIGMTGVEALAAYLGDSLSKGLNEESATKLLIEEQMEALLMDMRLDDQLDVGARFRQIRHENGFLAEEGGNYHFIKKEGDINITSELIEEEDPNKATRLTELNDLDQQWDEIRENLSTLNELQFELDTHALELTSLQEQLFADWYKYMVCAYPPENAWDSVLDVDDVRHFISEKSMDLIRVCKSKLEAVQAKLNPNPELGETSFLSLFLQDINSLNSGIGNWVDRINVFVEQKGKKAFLAPHFKLSQKPRPRFWKPRDPVVLAVGDALVPSNRYGRDGVNNSDGTLSCHLFNSDNSIQQLLTNSIERESFTSDLANLTEQIPSAFHIWKGRPWNPLRLEWKAQFLPVSNGSNIQHDATDYNTNFISQNFTLKKNDPDVSFNDVGGHFIPSAGTYSGATILTSSANKQIIYKLSNYLIKNVLEECLINEPDHKGYFEDTNTLPEDNFLKSISNITKVLEWYEGKRFPVATSITDKFGDLTYSSLKALAKLEHPGFNSLAQSLGGFNESLLMRKKTLQLKIKDPLAFSPYKNFTAEVAEAVGNTIRMAPLPQNEFNPLRAGKMKITGLRVVDSFGQFVDLKINRLITTELLEAPDNEQEVLLRPRLLQPAQVRFRWLSARQSNRESNEMNHNNPICGWVMNNNLDNSLMVFNADGKALGAFTESDLDWKPAPGVTIDFGLDTDLSKWEEETPSALNPHLYQMMFFIRYKMLDRKVEQPSFLNEFRKAIDSALENIVPNSFDRQQNIAHLIGRPLALVRASLDLVSKSPPAIHQGWDVFQLDMKKETRDTNAFTKTLFPIRIGEHNQLNDGVVGYWVESKHTVTTYEKDAFFSSSSAKDFKNDAIVTSASKGEPIVQFQSLDDTPLNISMLLDPHGKVNLTSGLLPSKTLDIPPSLFAKALNNMEIYFVSSPHLTRPKGLQMNLPELKGYKWSFIRKVNSSDAPEKTEWVTEIIQNKETSTPFFRGELTIKEGWLKLEKK